jgi:hypothetical protein
MNGFLNSIHLRRAGFNALPAGHEYDHHLDDVNVLDSILTGSRGVGLYVDGDIHRPLAHLGDDRIIPCGCGETQT